MKTFKIKNSEDGYTLLELLIVIAIIGMLATAGALQLSNTFNNSKKKTVEIQLQQLETAIKLYEIDTGIIPSAASNMLFLLENDDHEGWSGPYIKSKKNLVDPWRNRIEYVANLPEVYLISYGADGTKGGENENSDIKLLIRK